MGFNKIFNSDFIELSQKVYYINDERVSLKNKINKLTDSEIRKQKEHVDYQ